MAHKGSTPKGMRRSVARKGAALARGARNVGGGGGSLLTVGRCTRTRAVVPETLGGGWGGCFLRLKGGARSGEGVSSDP